MAKKASLDILDIESSEPPNIPAAKVEAPKDESASAPEPAVPEKKRSLRFRIVYGSFVAVILTASIFWFVLRETESGRQPRSVPAESVAQIAGAVANLLRFYVDFSDDQGRIRILACDVSLVVSDRADPARLEARTDLRSAIFRAVQGVSYARLVDPMGLQYLKAAVFSEVNRMLGLGVVNEVYLTNFLLM